MGQTIVGYKALIYDPEKQGLWGWHYSTSPQMFRNLGAACVVAEIQVELKEGYYLRERQQMIPAICEAATDRGLSLDYVMSEGLGKSWGMTLSNSWN